MKLYKKIEEALYLVTRGPVHKIRALGGSRGVPQSELHLLTVGEPSVGHP